MADNGNTSAATDTNSGTMDDNLKALQPFDTNKYATKKSITTNVLNLSLLITTCKQLRVVSKIQNPASSEGTTTTTATPDLSVMDYRNLLLVLLSLSIIIQVIILVGLIIQAYLQLDIKFKDDDSSLSDEEKKQQDERYKETQPMGNCWRCDNNCECKYFNCFHPPEHKKMGILINFAMFIACLVLLVVIVLIDVFGEFNTTIGATTTT